jgi:hypothetical protein
MKSISELLADGLPTTLSKAIAVALPVVITAAYNFPSIFPSTWISTSQEQLFLVRLLLSGTSLLIGTLIILFLVVRFYSTQQSRPALVANEGTASGTVNQTHSGSGDNVKDKTVNVHNAFQNTPDTVLVSNSNGIRTVERINASTGVTTSVSTTLSNNP